LLFFLFTRQGTNLPLKLLKFGLQGSQLSVSGLCFLSPPLPALGYVMHANLVAFEFGLQVLVFPFPLVTAPKKAAGQHPDRAAESIQFNHVSRRRGVPHLSPLEDPERCLSDRAIAQQKR
jgi:hypothetical protein